MFKIGYVDHMLYDSPPNGIYRPQGSGDYLFLYFPLPMSFETPETRTVTKENACVLFAPADAHKFNGFPLFLNSFVHFKDPDGIIKKYHIPTSKIFYSDCYEQINELIFKIKSEMLSGSEMSEEMAHLFLTELLILSKRSFSSEAGDGIKEKFEKLRYEMLSSCEKDISAYALSKQLCMSRTQFYEYYKRFFGTSPKNDIIKARMGKASVLLTDANKSVAEVAAESGFNNTEHFIRYYKQWYGTTPGRYRADKTSIISDK